MKRQTGGEVYQTNMKHRTVITVMLAFTGGVSLLLAADSKLTSNDSDFLKKAAQGGMAEVEIGRLAVKSSSNPAVRSFAQRMIRDHSAADQKLKALAATKGVDLPSGKGLGNDATYVKLKVLSGKTFDKAYVDSMVDDHKQDVADFEKESTDAEDPDVKAFAAKTLPTLKAHLAAIEKLQGEMAQ